MAEQNPNAEKSNLPAVVDKWAAVGDQMDAVVSQVSLSKTADMANFRRGMMTAVAIQHLRASLTDQNMGPIMALQGTSIGFRTDKDKEGGYPIAIVRDCVIDAALRGASLVGNEMNIIAERAYYTKEFYERVTGQLHGVSGMEPTFAEPRIAGEWATVEADCTWIFDGNPKRDRLAPGPGRESGRVLSIRVNKGHGPDQILGKARRKLLKLVYEQITGSPPAPDGDALEIDATVVSSRTMPPTGRTQVRDIADAGRENGTKQQQAEEPPKKLGPACEILWPAIQKMIATHTRAAVDDAKDDCGFADKTLEQCDARELGEVTAKVREWVISHKITTPINEKTDTKELESAGAKSEKGKLKF
jgi:hypothetical protein